MLTMMIPTASSDGPAAGDFVMIGYGLRFSGDVVGGDVGFMVPIFDGAGDIFKVVPLGIPFISLSVIL